LEALAETADKDQAPQRLKDLQSACAELDEVTKPLAELLMDRAMEAMLRKRGIL
jgi:hypothetical protein